jgi:maleylacetoacetate isomerase
VSDPVLRLHSYWRSSAAYRVRIALNVKGLAYDCVPQHLARGEHRQAAYLGANPQGLVPALETGEGVIAQSLAIIEYLEEGWPEPPLLPKGAFARATVRAMAQGIACDIHPLNNLRVLQYLRGPLGLPEEAVQAWYGHWIAEGLRPLEALVARHSRDGRHCYGNEVTVADLCLVPQLYNARRFRCELAPYPRLVSIGEYLESLPEFVNAKPELQPDAE